MFHQPLRKRKCAGVLLAVLILVFQGCAGPPQRSVSSEPNVRIAAESVIVDPALSGIARSPQYTVRVNEGLDSFVYQIQNPGFLSNGQPSGIASSSTLEKSTAWTSFSFKGTVAIQITNRKPFTSARILPSHAQIIPQVSGNTVTFMLTRPGQFAIDFCYEGSICTNANADLSNPLLVFANSIESNIPDTTSISTLSVTPGLSVPTGDSSPKLRSNQNTFYFGPGVYDLGITPLTVASGQTVYLASGAYVKGFIDVAFNATNVSIRGRGILSGENLPKAHCIGTKTGCPYMILGRGPNLRNISIEGLTLIQAPYHNLILRNGGSNTINNVKILGWLGNNDGIQASVGPQDTGSVIENSFIKTGDDAILLSGSNLTVKNCVVWHLRNAAVFQMGSRVAGDLKNITVRNSDVIRSEYAWPGQSTAIFAANHGGSGTLSNYTFDDIRIENSSWQLFQIMVIPSNFQAGNTTLGSISHLSFNNIQVAEAQKFPPVFRGYNLNHQVSNVTFNNVIVGGIPQSNPTITLNANRNMSYSGNTVGNMLYRSEQNPADFVVPVFTLPSPQYFLVPLSLASVTSQFTVKGHGDFFGDGFASAVILNEHRKLGIWEKPFIDSGQYTSIYTLASSDGDVAGVGDFNGDGYSDIALWNKTTQTGKLLLIIARRVVDQIAFRPKSASGWSVTTIADFDGDGYSDVLLRDQIGNLETIAFNLKSGAPPTLIDYPVSSLNYSPTEKHKSIFGKNSGNFDRNWKVIGSGVFKTLSAPYAAILWQNPKTGDLGVTDFTPFQTPSQMGRVFARLPSNTQIRALGDFNGDGAKDLLLWNSAKQESSILWMNYFGGELYQLGPVLNPALSRDWVFQGN